MNTAHDNTTEIFGDRTATTYSRIESLEHDYFKSQVEFKLT